MGGVERWWVGVGYGGCECSGVGVCMGTGGRCLCGVGVGNMRGVWCR